MRSGPPQQAFSTPVVHSSPSTLGAHPLPFSALPSPQFSPSSLHPSPVLASLPIPSPPPLPSLPTLLASLHSLLLHLRQVAQCSVTCPFLTDIACHYVSLCRSLICLPPPSFLVPSATGESTWDLEVFIIIIIIFPFWWLSFNKHSISLVRIKWKNFIGKTVFICFVRLEGNQTLIAFCIRRHDGEEIVSQDIDIW